MLLNGSFFFLFAFLSSSRQEDRYHSFDCECSNKEETGRACPPPISLAQILVVNGKCQPASDKSLADSGCLTGRGKNSKNGNYYLRWCSSVQKVVGHFTTYCPMERHFTIYCPLEGHSRKCFIVFFLPWGHARGHFYSIFSTLGHRGGNCPYCSLSESPTATRLMQETYSG